MIKINGKDIIIVDSHTHVWNEFKGQRFGNVPIELLPYGKAKQGNKIFQFLPPEYCDNKVKVEILLAHMEYLNIDKAVIIQNPCYGDQREYVNDILKKYPNKFVGIGMIDPRDKEKVGEEIDILIDKYKFKGVKMEIPDVPFIMDDPEYDFLWKKIIEKDIIAVIDLGWGKGQYDYNIDRLRNVLKKYVNIKMVLSHLGISMLWDFTQKYPFDKLQNTLSLLDINRDNLWFDFSNIQDFDPDEYPYYRSQEILKAVKKSYGMDRIMWGSDFPTILKLCTFRQCLNFVIRHCDFLTDKELEEVLGLNALNVYFN